LRRSTASEGCSTCRRCAPRVFHDCVKKFWAIAGYPHALVSGRYACVGPLGIPRVQWICAQKYSVCHMSATQGTG
jgi:hypothetical protein